MRSLFSVVAPLLLVMLLGACATTNNGNGGGNGEPPPGAFTVAVTPNAVDVVRGDPTGATITVTVAFDSNYDDHVRIERSVLPQGISVRFGGTDIQQNPPVMTQSGSLDLQVVVDASAEGFNDFTQIHGQGVSESGSTSGKPLISGSVRFNVQ